MRVGDALAVELGGEIERGAQRRSGSIDAARGQPLGQQAITPAPQLARGQRAHQPRQQRRGQMPAHVRGIGRVAAAGAQVVCVKVEGLADRQRPVAAIVSNPARRLAGRVERLPIRHDGAAIGRLIVIGERQALNPIGAVAIGATHAPCAGAGVSPVAEPNAGAYREPIGFLARLEAAAGGGSSSWAARGLGTFFSPVSGRCLEQRSRVTGCLGGHQRVSFCPVNNLDTASCSVMQRHGVWIFPTRAPPT